MALHGRRWEDAALRRRTDEGRASEHDDGRASDHSSDRHRAPSRAGRAARVGEFLVVGGATLALWPLSWGLRHVVAIDDAELAVGFFTFYAAWVINDPHFSVTYLLFYRSIRERLFGERHPRAQRIRYAVAGFVVPACLVAWAVIALARHDAQLLGWMVQLMYLLVGWHYVKQGFGVLAVLSARRGVSLTPRERTIFIAHALTGWAFAWANPASTAGEFEEKGVVYWAPAHPHWLELLAGAALAASTLALVAVLAGRARRRAMIPAAPLAGFLVSIWSWSILSSVDPLLRYAIPALHSIQYLYFVALMRRNEARAHEGAPHFGKPVAVRLGYLAAGALLLGALLFHGLPSYLDAMFVGPQKEMGPTPFFAAVFVIVNIHHYFMDHVIWRRENPETIYLRA